MSSDKTRIKITSKTTKQDIIDTYESILKKMEQDPKNPKQEVIVKQIEEKLEVANQATVQNVLNDISNFKLKVSSSLDDISNDILSQIELFVKIKESVEIEQKRLKDIYDIEIRLDSLASLINTYKIREAELIQSYEQEEAKFTAKCDQLTQEFNEKKQNLVKEQTREKEEYLYNLKFSRKKEEEAFEYNKQLKINELNEREKVILEKEECLAILNEKVASFPDQLNKAIEDAKKELAHKLTHEFNREKENMLQKFESDKILNETILKSINTKTEEQALVITHLNDRLAEANKQVENIALTAINGAQKVIYQPQSIESQKK